MDPQQAIDSPHVFYDDGAATVEGGTSAEAISGLKQLGHNVVPAQEPLGGGQAIWIDWERGTLTGESDPPRTDAPSASELAREE